jgi:hypothetical protein
VAVSITPLTLKEDISFETEMYIVWLQQNALSAQHINVV